jgi:hypothetical protein
LFIYLPTAELQPMAKEPISCCRVREGGREGEREEREREGERG